MEVTIEGLTDSSLQEIYTEKEHLLEQARVRESALTQANTAKAEEVAALKDKVAALQEDIAELQVRRTLHDVDAILQVIPSMMKISLLPTSTCCCHPTERQTILCLVRLI